MSPTMLIAQLVCFLMEMMVKDLTWGWAWGPHKRRFEWHSPSKYFLQVTITSSPLIGIKDRRLWFTISSGACSFASLRGGLRMGNVGGLASVVLPFVLILLWCGGSLSWFIELFFVCGFVQHGFGDVGDFFNLSMWRSFSLAFLHNHGFVNWPSSCKYDS